ncbi:MAG: quinone-interacting membrane-bound oxidoreductase complex subunit QmoC [Thermodesulfobacteriota bacterium]
MAALKVDPNVKFIEDLQAAGGESLKKCYQCATCSVVCPLSPEKNPFPRKEMIWAQWGMKDKLVNDIDIWLCHNCGECSDLCPRGANPGDVLASLRNMAYRSLAKPAVFGKWMSSSKYLPILFAIPALIYLIIWGFTTGLSIPAGEVIYGKVFPGDYTIDPVFGLVAVFVIFSFASAISKLLASFRESGQVPGEDAPSIWKSLYVVIKDQILTHSKFKDCASNKDRYPGHLWLFYGFIALFVVTSIIAVGHWGGLLIGHQMHTPLALWNPIKILANLGAIALVVGLTLITRMRLDYDPAKQRSSFYDWYLIGVIWVIAVTGILCEILRLAALPALAYPMYYLHLISVFMLIAYLPWSKLAHLVYRTVALAYAHQIGRKGPSE